MKNYRGQEYCVIPYNQMTPKRAEATMSIMIVGNKELKRLHRELLKKNRLGTKKYSRATFRQEFFVWVSTLGKKLDRIINNKSKSSPFSFFPSVTNRPQIKRGKELSREVRVSGRAIKRILHVKSIQDEVLSGFSRLIEKLAIKFWKNNKEMSLSVQDYYDEGVMGAINAIYHYSQEDASFMTYIHTCIHHRMIRVVNENHPLSTLTNEARKLKRRYEKVQNIADSHVTFDEVCELCGFTKNEIEEVAVALHKVAQSSVFELGINTDNFEESTERKIGRREFDSMCLFVNQHRIDTQEVEKFDYDQLEAIESARQYLNEFENAILDAIQFDGERGWQIRVSASHINPETGKPYSRRAPAVILPRIIEIIRKEYCGEEQDQQQQQQRLKNEMKREPQILEVA